MKTYKHLALILMLFAAFIAEAQTFPNNIPTSHRRIWWNTQRLNQAQTWFTTHPFNPSTSTNPVESSSDPTGNAMKYVLTGNTTNARVAINWALNAINTMPTSGLTCDQCRWYGEESIIAFDWCYDQMTATERSTFTTKMNQVVTAFNATSWGNNNPESNYFWGYQRLSLMWGIASYWENTTNATTFVNNALQTKWDGIFIPYSNRAPGGIPAEGVDYGYTVETYPVVPFETMKVYGRDMYAETDYFKRSIFNNIYSMLPGLTYDNPGRSTPGKSWFPFGDSGDFLGAQDPILRSGAKDFMKSAAIRWNSIKIGQYSRKWLSTLNASFPKLYDAIDPGGSEADFSSLPLDYFSTGDVGHAFMRTQWGQQASIVHLQLASPAVIGHEHFDTGNWQIWRNQRFLSRESPGRGTGSGYSYVGYNNVGRVDAEASVNHNVLLFGGQGHASGSDIPSTVGNAQVLRMETAPTYFYSVVDVTPSYLNSNKDNPAWSNNNISHAEREFIFIRPLEALFIFDRTESISTANTTKTFLAHFQNQPTLDGTQAYLSVNGNQAFRLQTLLPANLPTNGYRLINEQSSKTNETGNPYRLEVEQSGTGVQYFMHVAQARDASDASLTASVTDNGSTYTVTISHPTKGGVKIILNKGINTSGGSFGFSPTGIPSTTSPLRTTVQGISVTDDGPIWSGTTSCSYSLSANSANAPSSASTGSITVTAGTSCTWTATSNVPWLTITSGASGSGNGTVGYSVAANSGAARSGTMNIAGQTFTVNQTGVIVNCQTAPASGTWINSPFANQTGTFTVSFDAAPSLNNMDAVVGLSNAAQTSYANFACIVSFDASGVLKARNGGSYTAATSIPYTGGSTYHFREVVNVATHTYSIFVTPPGGSELTLGSNYAFRTEQNAITQINNWGAAVDATVSSGTLAVCNFIIGGTTCTYGISSTNASFTSAANTGSVTVTANTGCAWAATENLNWVTITSGASGTGNGTVNYSITANTGSARSGVITIAGQSFTVNQAAPVTGSLLDFYVDETTSSFSFTGGTVGVTASVAAEGLVGSNCLKYSTFPDQWGKTPVIHYATPKNISSVLATDVLRISIDISPAPSTYIIVMFNNNYAVNVTTPVIDKVAGFQTFDISLSSIRTALGNTVNDIYFSAGDGFPAGATLKVDEIRFVRPGAGGGNAAIADMSTSESGLTNRFNVYPNPGKDEVKIELGDAVGMPAPLSVIDQSGKIVAESIITAGTTSAVINTRGLAPGVYIVRLRLAQELVTRKIVIIRD
jgi:hypothetical protein